MREVTPASGEERPLLELGEERGDGQDLQAVGGLLAPFAAKHHETSSFSTAGNRALPGSGLLQSRDEDGCEASP